MGSSPRTCEFDSELANRRLGTVGTIRVPVDGWLLAQLAQSAALGQYAGASRGHVDIDELLGRDGYDLIAVPNVELAAPRLLLEPGPEGGWHCRVVAEADSGTGEREQAASAHHLEISEEDDSPPPDDVVAPASETSLTEPAAQEFAASLPDRFDAQVGDRSGRDLYEVAFDVGASLRQRLLVALQGFECFLFTMMELELPRESCHIALLPGASDRPEADEVSLEATGGPGGWQAEADPFGPGSEYEVRLILLRSPENDTYGLYVELASQYAAHRRLQSEQLL